MLKEKFSPEVLGCQLQVLVREAHSELQRLSLFNKDLCESLRQQRRTWALCWEAEATIHAAAAGGFSETPPQWPHPTTSAGKVDQPEAWQVAAAQHHFVEEHSLNREVRWCQETVACLLQFCGGRESGNSAREAWPLTSEPSCETRSRLGRALSNAKASGESQLATREWHHVARPLLSHVACRTTSPLERDGDLEAVADAASLDELQGRQLRDSEQLCVIASLGKATTARILAVSEASAAGRLAQTLRGAELQEAETQCRALGALVLARSSATSSLIAQAWEAEAASNAEAQQAQAEGRRVAALADLAVQRASAALEMRAAARSRTSCSHWLASAKEGTEAEAEEDRKVEAGTLARALWPAGPSEDVELRSSNWAAEAGQLLASEIQTSLHWRLRLGERLCQAELEQRWNSSECRRLQQSQHDDECLAYAALQQSLRSSWQLEAAANARAVASRCIDSLVAEHSELQKEASQESIILEFLLDQQSAEVRQEIRAREEAKSLRCAQQAACREVTSAKSAASQEETEYQTQRRRLQHLHRLHAVGTLKEEKHLEVGLLASAEEAFSLAQVKFSRKEEEHKSQFHTGVEVAERREGRLAPQLCEVADAEFTSDIRKAHLDREMARRAARFERRMESKLLLRLHGVHPENHG